MIALGEEVNTTRGLQSDGTQSGDGRDVAVPDGGEDRGGEEHRLDEVPVLGEVLVNNTDTCSQQLKLYVWLINAMYFLKTLKKDDKFPTCVNTVRQNRLVIRQQVRESLQYLLSNIFRGSEEKIQI